MPSVLTQPALQLQAIQLLTAAFLAVLFLQSGLDKVIDRAGNLGWLQGHFAKSPLAGMVPLLLTIITLLEVLAGLVSAGGAVMLLVGAGTALATWGALLSALCLLSLFFGQRMAKDYAGAGALVPYFVLTMLAVALNLWTP